MKFFSSSSRFSDLANFLETKEQQHRFRCLDVVHRFGFQRFTFRLSTMEWNGQVVVRAHADPRLCVTCNQRPPGTMFLPCSHVIACPGCADIMERCQLCDQNILGTLDLVNVPDHGLIKRHDIRKG